MSPVEKMYQLVNNEYAICFDAFTRRWTPGKPLHAKTKAIEGVLMKVLPQWPERGVPWMAIHNV